MSANTQTGMTVSATISNAEFQAIGQFFAAVFDAGGFTRTADTGQIDWSTAAWPGANNTSGGYEIREFTDALQATAPIKFKFSYRRGGGANIMEIGLTVGLTSNGSGSIGGALTIEILFQTNITTVAAAMQLSASATPWGMLMFFYANSANQSSILTIERTADLDGTLNNKGCIVTWIGTSGSMRYLPRAGAIPSTDALAAGSGNCLQPASILNGLDGVTGDVNIFPIFPHSDGGTIVQPLQFLVIGYATNFGLSATPTVSIRGSSVVMLTPPIAQCPNHTIGGASGLNSRFLMRYQ